MNDSGFDSATGPIIRIERAVRKGSHVLISLYGFSGCGKTLSAIYLARGLVGPQGRICMIDTETDRGLIYSLEAGGYDRAELTPPFTPERYIEAIKTVEKAGYDALILDQASSEWEGIGGIVEMADAATDGQGKPQGVGQVGQPKGAAQEVRSSADRDQDARHRVPAGQRKNDPGHQGQPREIPGHQDRRHHVGRLHQYPG